MSERTQSDSPGDEGLDRRPDDAVHGQPGTETDADDMGGATGITNPAETPDERERDDRRGDG